MTHTSQGISALRQRMIDDMRMRKLAPGTQSGYIRVVRQFTAFLGRPPDTATVEDLRRYQLHLVDHGISPVSLNAAITGLKFFFEVTLNRAELMARMQPVRVPRTLPVVLSPEEVARLIAAAGNLKHQTALSVAYGTGLRASEVVALKVGDVDSQRMTLRIEQGKGRRDRYAMLSPVLLERLSLGQLKVMSAIEQCRTAALGGHVLRCSGCAAIDVAFNSCRDRHCPKCQASAARRWLEARQADLLPVEYYHVVFTLPAAISAIAWYNKAVIYGLLFDVAAETLRTIAADPRHLGAQIGATLVLHTWGSALTHHPHVHGIVPGGGLSPDAERWVACRSGFFLPVRVLSRLFRRRFLEELAALHRRGQLRFFGEYDALADPAVFAQWLAPLRACEWVVFAKRPFAGPEAVLAYLSRYTHRVAISNQRLIALDERGVTFRWKDYRAKGRTRYKVMTLSADEFMRRFLLHVLPAGFHRTRRDNPKVSSAAAVNYLMFIKPTGESGEIVTLNIDDATTGRSFMGVFRAAALAGILAFVLCLASGKLKAMAGEIVPIWIVDGYVVAHVMVASRKKKFAVLAGGILGILGANFWVGEGLYVASSFTFAGLLEICVAVALAPRVHRAKELAEPKAFLRFLLACFVASLVSGVAAVVLLQGFFTVHPFSSFSNWVISDALGFLIFTPTSLVVASGELVDFWKSSNRNWSLVLLGILGVATAVIFSQTTYDLLYWILPPLAVLAFQTELAVVLIGTLLFIAIAVPLTIHGSGPLWLVRFFSMQERILALQVFILAALSVALPIALMQAQRNRLLALLTHSERRYRMLAENADDAVLQISILGDISYASPRVTTTLGYAANTLVGRNILSLVFEEDRKEVVEAISRAGGHGLETSVIYRIRRSDASLGWVRSFASAERGDTSTSESLLALTIRDIDASLHEQQRRKAHEAELERLAYVDSLTGLFNRRHFDAELSARTEKKDGQRLESFGLLLIDVDYFKNYNDRYGHQAGDECLKTVASCIAASVHDRDIVARYGGEEFTVIVDSSEGEDSATVAERVRSAVEALGIQHQGSPFEYVTLSIGLAYTRTAGTSAQMLLNEADAALYEAKRNGRNQVRAPKRDSRWEDGPYQ